MFDRDSFLVSGLGAVLKSLASPRTHVVLGTRAELMLQHDALRHQHKNVEAYRP